MATYYEFKQMVGRIFGHTVKEDNNDDIYVCFQNKSGIAEEKKNIDFVIHDAELQELFNRVKELPSEGLELFSSTSYEIALTTNSPEINNINYPLLSQDVDNGITYTLGIPTIEYCAFLLINIIDETNNKISRCLPVLMKLDQTLNSLMKFRDDKELLILQNLLPKLFRKFSLRINTNQEVNISEFRQYKTSFIFEFMYRAGFVLIEFLDINKMFNLTRESQEQKILEQLDTPPLRKYLDAVVDYYKMALSVRDSYTKFISFYHVMEYFYDAVFRKNIISTIREKITNPGFSYKDDEKIYDIAKVVRNRLKMNDESGQGNELESLKFVLNEYVPIDQLKQRISEIDATAVQYYQANKVTFCDAPVIPWTNMQGIYAQLARRIYFVRNSLVHSKSGKSQERYNPYKDKLQLQKELPLVEAIAELIIINSSSIIE